MRTVTALLVAAALAACHGEAALKIPADRPTLGWTGSSATDRNAALVPKGFTTPDEHACAADPTRAYLAELALQGIDKIEVNYHWAPIVPGPRPILPTLDQPELDYAGLVGDVNDSGDDVLGDHPFGLDIDLDIQPDPAFAILPYNGARTSPAGLHTEVEQRILPRASLGFSPQAGDRAILRGVWVLDCGHPPYGSEMHPPTFLAFSRAASAQETIAAAVVVPYRSTLLFNENAQLADDFANDARLGAETSRPFEPALVADVEDTVLGNGQNLAIHALMQANRFDQLDWLVCAPLPKPAGASFFASWRFAARTGVSIAATQFPSDGCVRFVATMSKSYAPMALPHVDAPWPWAQLSASASGQLGQTIDVRQAIINDFKARGIDASNAPALQLSNPPLVDAYPALQTRPGADADSPTAIDTRADDQPFPFYGRARAGWR